MRCDACAGLLAIIASAAATSSRHPFAAEQPASNSHHTRSTSASVSIRPGRTRGKGVAPQTGARTSCCGFRHLRGESADFQCQQPVTSSPAGPAYPLRHPPAERKHAALAPTRLSRTETTSRTPANKLTHSPRVLELDARSGGQGGTGKACIRRYFIKTLGRVEQKSKNRGRMQVAQ